MSSLPAGPPAIRARSLTKRFGALTANDRVSLEVQQGEIHGLLGENGAGKSTLMNLVYGLHQPDEGSIELKGRPVKVTSPSCAVELGIGMVHQHFMLISDMTVAENIALGPSRLPGLSRLDQVSERIQHLSEQFGLDVDPHATIEGLPLSAQQRVEIVKMLYRRVDLLILDEPTAALTPGEWRDLARFLKDLAATGKSIIFITHKLDELFDVADRCTVLRDGKVVGTVEMSATSKPELARMMVGREVSLRATRDELEPGRPVVQVKGLTVAAEGRTSLHDVTFDVREHEILGIAGVGGNGQDVLVDALIGILPAAGEIWFDGQLVEQMTPRLFRDLRGAVITEDRHREGVAVELSLRDNLLMKEITKSPYSRRGILNPMAGRRRCEQLIDEYGIKAPGIDAPLRHLSGGNQQKAVFARELCRDPRFVIAAQPTRGLDVGAMEFVYERLNARKRAGDAVLLVSAELDEVLSLADRIAVMVDGRITGVLPASDATAEAVGLLMAGEVQRDDAVQA